MTFSITVDLNDAPIPELNAADPKAIETYAQDVDKRGNNGAALVLRWLADEVEKQRPAPPTTYFKPGDIVRSPSGSILALGANSFINLSAFDKSPHVYGSFDPSIVTNNGRYNTLDHYNTANGYELVAVDR